MFHSLKNKSLFMKKIVIAILMIGTLPAFAQKLKASKVPEAANTEFTKAFPKASETAWERENGNYKAVFTDGKEHVTAIFDESGKRIETRFAMETKQLPGNVTKYVADNYSGKEITSVTRVVRPNAPQNIRCVVDGKSLLFGPNGQFLKAE